MSGLRTPWRPFSRRNSLLAAQSVLNKILLATFLFLFLGKLFFRPQLFAIKKWFDGVINAMLIAIVLVYLVRLIMWLSSGVPL